MLETVRNTSSEQSKNIDSHKNKQQSLYLLEKYTFQIMIQYESALLQFDQDDKRSNDTNSKLQTILNKLLGEKINLQRTAGDLLEIQQRAEWENKSLNKQLAEQQQQLNAIREEKEQKEEKQTLIRAQNLKQLKQQQGFTNWQSSEEQTIMNLSLKKQQIQQLISKVRQENQQNRSKIAKKSQQIHQREQQNLVFLNKIEANEQIVEKNTVLIEKALTKQSDLTKYFSQLKRKKKDLINKIREITPQLQQEQTITDELLQVQNKLQQKTYFINNRQQNVKQQISQIQSSCNHQAAQVKYNTDCLLKLSSYLQTLRSENQKIECFMESVLEQDYHVKTVIDKKYKNKNRKTSWDKTWSTMNS